MILSRIINLSDIIYFSVEKNTLNKDWEEQQALLKSQKLQLKEQEKEVISTTKHLTYFMLYWCNYL